MSNSNLFVEILTILNVAVFGCYLMAIGKGDPWRKLGRVGSWTSMIISGIAVLLLSYLFLNNTFSIRYIYENCALDMKPIYKITAVWAGQDGTFLLWLFFLNVVSVIMLRTTGKYEDWSLLYMKALEMMLCVLLLHRSPFAPTPMGADLSDGLGMNALLMNPWMVAHPPIMFIGYAAAAAPFAIFMAGISMGEPRKWVSLARGWILSAWGILGVGIFLGMYWSYEVLGWGGYWAWDPVENASIFPWVILCGAAHGALLQGYRKSFVLWNGVMVSAAYSMVIFGTFLTRSGVLADFSVHSFPDIQLYFPLLFALIYATALGVIFCVKASMMTPKDEVAETEKNNLKSTILSWSIYFFILFFLFVIVGTILPLVTKLMGATQSPPEQSYYNKMSLLPGVPLSLILLITPVVFAAKKNRPFPNIALILGGVAGVGAVAYLLSLGVISTGVRSLPALVILFAGTGALVTNATAFVLHLKAGQKSYASYLSHIGLALMFVGIVLSSLGSAHDRLILGQGESDHKVKMDVTVKELRFEQMSTVAEIDVTAQKKKHDARLEFVGEKYRRKKVNKPWIIRGAEKDIYLSPVQIVQTGGSAGGAANPDQVVQVVKGQTTDAGNGVNVTFEKYDLTRMGDGVVGIVLRFDSGDSSETVTLDYGTTDKGEVRGKYDVPGKNMFLRLVGMNVDDKMVVLEKSDGAYMKATAPGYAAVFELSTKPLIWTLWLGMVVLSVGTLLASWRRYKAAPVSE